MDEKASYLHLLYREGINQVRCYIDSRYKILQFVGFYNAAVLTFGFSQHVLSTTEVSFGGILLSILSILVALMGISTEFSLVSYNKEYFKIIRKIENELNCGAIDEVGVFTHGAKSIESYNSHKILPVHRAHKFFYVLLMLFWIGFLIFQIGRF